MTTLRASARKHATPSNATSKSVLEISGVLTFFINGKPWQVEKNVVRSENAYSHPPKLEKTEN